VSAVAIVARKELRAYFQSPVALIFLGVFLAATHFAFFAHAAFFARGLADVRPLFEWLPLLLVFLVAAITMRQWAEERKMGTLEVLLTLPVGSRDLVLGKFVAGVGLVALALGMTLPLPLMVSLLGDLDWGPVVGGYLGALLLGAAYLSIGLCVSARTDNQVVSLMLTGLIAALLYLLGSDAFTSFFGSSGADLLRALGTGSRFESIERGVLDLRDLVYYGGLAAFFLTLNWGFLERERMDADSEAGGHRARALGLWVAAVGVNVLLLDLWLAPVTLARVDLTEGGEYSISDVTVRTLSQLDEPLSIEGYFSERTHPLLAPLVPQIRDLVAEYEIHGGDRVEVSFQDPNADEELEAEIGERYGIRSFPFRVADRHQQAVVNSFFHLLVRYGDEYETLSFDELIEVAGDDQGIEVRLRNLEYDLTRTIKRVSQDFQSTEAILARLPEGTILTLYATPGTIPEALAEVPGRIRTIVGELVRESGGRLGFEEIDPSGDAALQDRLQDEYGIRPLAVDLFGRETFYLDVLLRADERVQRVVPRSDLGEGDLRRGIEAALRRITPGQLTTVGLFTETPAPPPPNPQLPPQMQPPPPQPDLRVLEQVLAEDYEVERLDLGGGRVPEHIDVLIVAKPGALTRFEQFAIDQYLMKGGRVLALAGAYRVSPQRGALSVQETSAPFLEMLAHWGVEVGPGLVMDPQNAAFPLPVQEQRGRFRVQRIEMMPYPFFPDVRSDGFAAESPVLGGLQNVTTPWASPISLAEQEGVEAEALLQSSPGSGVDESGSIDPDFQLYPETGFSPPDPAERRTLAVALRGRFDSYFADKPSPLFEQEAEDGEGEIDATGRTLEHSLADARLVVVSSSELVSDLMLQLANQIGGEVHRSNLQLVQNLVDWSTEDLELLAIRSAGGYARTLRPLDEGATTRWELGQYAAAALMLGAVALLPRRQRRSVTPIDLSSAGQGGAS